MMNTIVGAALFGGAAAMVVLLSRQFAGERRGRNRMLEQVGLREPEIASETRGAADRRKLLLIAASLMLGVAAFTVFGFIGLFLGAVPIGVDAWLTKRSARKREAALMAELAPALQLLVDNLRVGRDLTSALAEVAKASGEPVATIFETVVAESRLGTRVDRAFAEIAEREQNRHLEVVSSAIGLNVEFGGNLVEILGGVVESLEEEDRLRRDIDSVTADGRLSSKVLLALPPITLVVVSVMSPGYAKPLIETGGGRMMSMVGVLLAVAGWYWLRRLSDPDIVA